MKKRTIIKTTVEDIENALDECIGLSSDHHGANVKVIIENERVLAYITYHGLADDATWNDMRYVERSRELIFDAPITKEEL